VVGCSAREAAIMQKKLEEYNRAIEEETQQLQSLASAITPALPSLVAAALRDDSPAIPTNAIPSPEPVVPETPPAETIEEPMELDIPLPPPTEPPPPPVSFFYPFKTKIFV